MSSKLRQHIIEIYEIKYTNQLPGKFNKLIPIQIDDQNDYDILDKFVNLFCTVKQRNTLRVEICGKFPITEEINSFIKKLNGNTDKHRGKVSFKLKSRDIEKISDLCEMLKKTDHLGPVSDNIYWESISKRTVASLHRFIETINEFNKAEGSAEK
ncbi:hypothetical protein CHISP_0335 [Chitinispirillum alkaliphilum]|nr:hypothetical protein CHISP_0335 [Chitinispirillum alkaliphilum]